MMKSCFPLILLLVIPLFTSATCFAQSLRALDAGEAEPDRIECVVGPPKVVSKPHMGSSMPITTCQAALEPYFPGDFNFCAGSNAYSRGRWEQAIQLYELAAAWGDKSAQFNLGLMYLRGDHIQANRPLGLAWLALAAERPEDKDKRSTLVAFYTSASTEERKSADALWNQLKLKYADAIALERARTRYDRQTRRLRREAIRDPMGDTCISGFAGGYTSTIVKDLDKVANEKLALNTGNVTVGNLQPAKSETPKGATQPPKTIKELPDKTP